MAHNARLLICINSAEHVRCRTTLIRAKISIQVLSDEARINATELLVLIEIKSEMFKRCTMVLLLSIDDQGVIMLSRRTLIASSVAAAGLGATGYALWPRLDGYHEELIRQRRLLSSEPTLKEFVRLSTLAANGHNTQPWKFHLEENVIRILPDFSRRTLVVDPDDHHLFVSLGCAAENLSIAAASSGRQPDVSFQHKNGEHVEINLGFGKPSNDLLYRAIPFRQSTRATFDGQPISRTDLELLKKAAQQEGVSVQFFEDKSDLEAILEFVIEGNSIQMDDPAFIKELRDWIRFSSDNAITSGDGLFSACSGNPVVPEWIGKRLFQAFFTKETENDKYREHIQSSAGIAVFIGDKSDPEHWINVGRSFERFALQATALGIRNSHLNQPIEVPAIRSEFASWLEMPNARPDLVIRFGRAPALPMSLRRPIETVLV